MESTKVPVSHTHHNLAVADKRPALDFIVCEREA